MAKKLSCIVSGRTITIANSYYNKKVEKAGSEEKLNSTYICKEAKKLLRLGNNIENVREKCEEICTAIMNVSTMDDFKAIFENEYNEDETIKTKAKRQDFPDDYNVKGYKR